MFRAAGGSSQGGREYNNSDPIHGHNEDNYHHYDHHDNGHDHDRGNDGGSDCNND